MNTFYSLWFRHVCNGKAERNKRYKSSKNILKKGLFIFIEFTKVSVSNSDRCRGC